MLKLPIVQKQKGSLPVTGLLQWSTTSRNGNDVTASAKKKKKKKSYVLYLKMGKNQEKIMFRFTNDHFISNQNKNVGIQKAAHSETD